MEKRKIKEHEHDPQHCAACRKLRTLWLGHGFQKAMSLLGLHYEKFIKKDVQKVWRDLPRGFVEQEILKISKEAWNQVQKQKR